MTFYEEVLDKTTALMVAAFGLVAALAWNGAIQAVFRHYFGTADNIAAHFTYAILVTILAVLAIIWIARMSAKAAEEKKKE